MSEMRTIQPKHSVVTIKRRESYDRLNGMMASFDQLAVDDPDNKFGWAWLKNYKKFMSVANTLQKRSVMDETKEQVAYKRDVEKLEKDLAEKAKSQGPTDIQKLRKSGMESINIKHKTALQQELEHKAFMEKYENEIVKVEIHMVLPDNHPPMSPKMIMGAEFMLVDPFPELQDEPGVNDNSKEQ